MHLLFALKEVLPDDGGQFAADTVVRKEEVEVPQQLTLGLKRLVLRHQHLEGYHLVGRRRPKMSPVCGT